MQHGRYEDASDLYGMLLLQQLKQKKDAGGDMGDIIHARCASYLERGLLNDARRMWKEAYELYPNHDGIALYVQKIMAYGDDGDDDGHQDNVCQKNITESDDVGFDTYLDGKCFVSHSDRPVFTQEECQRVIQWAERYASSTTTTTNAISSSSTSSSTSSSSNSSLPPSGWTTSRHYAVPTTDIPLHTKRAKVR